MSKIIEIFGKKSTYSIEIILVSKIDMGGFQLLDLIITELKSHMTC